MDWTEMLLLLGEGLLESLKIVLLSSILPLIVGIGLTCLARTHKITSKVLTCVSFPTEALCIPVLMVTLFYVPSLVLDFNLGRAWTVVIALSLGLLMYMPSRHVDEYSLPKNLLYNGLGLISSVVKWSCVAGFVGVMDFLKASEMLMSRTYDPLYLLVPFLVLLVIVGVLEAARAAVKAFMK